jgi:prepilin-type N-terminal cleavage/methylation domain-containing protein
MKARIISKLKVVLRRRPRQRGFTLVEMLLATLIVLVGLVAVAQLVPSSLMINANNRSDGTALVLAQKQMEALRAVPLSQITFTDPSGTACPATATCNVGDRVHPNTFVGSPFVLLNGSPVIDFSQPIVDGYGFTYSDLNDPTGAVNDIRWAVATAANGSVTSRRIVVGAFRRGMNSPSYPISLDTMVYK